MIEDNDNLGKILDRKQLKKLSNQIDPPTKKEFLQAIKNTVSQKALADDAMLQNLFKKKNFTKLVCKEEEFIKNYNKE